MKPSSHHRDQILIVWFKVWGAWLNQIYWNSGDVLKCDDEIDSMTIYHFQAVLRAGFAPVARYWDNCFGKNVNNEGFSSSIGNKTSSLTQHCIQIYEAANNQIKRKIFFTSFKRIILIAIEAKFGPLQRPNYQDSARLTKTSRIRETAGGLPPSGRRFLSM